MTAVTAVWDFIAGDSRRTPVAVTLAVVAALVLHRAGVGGVALAAGFVGILAVGLTLAVFEP